MLHTNRDDLKVSTRVLYDELIRQQVPTAILDTTLSLLEFSDRHNQTHFLISTCSDKSSATGIIIADNKARTTLIANRMGIRTPQQEIFNDIRGIRKFLQTHKRIVIKPVLGSGGSGVSTDITSRAMLERAYAYAKGFSTQVVVQQHITGQDVRLLIVGGTFASAVIRKPAFVIGDGLQTLEALILEANSDISRNDDTQSSLMHISINAAHRFLSESMTVVPNKDEEVQVVGPANVSLGGSLHEATTLVTAAMIQEAEAITNKLGLGICGVDMIWDQSTNQHHLIEVNATPGIDIHNDPFSGTKSTAIADYVKWLVA